MRTRTPPLAVDGAAGALGRMRISVLRSALSLALASAVPAAGESLLRPVAEGVGAAKRVALEADPYVARWRVAGMDREAVFGASAGDEPLVMQLFGDVEVRARVESAKTLEGGSRFLAGALEDGGHFTLFRHSTGAVRGEFHLGEGVFYGLRSQSAGRVLVTQADVSALPGCGNEGLSGGAAGLVPAPVGAAADADDRRPVGGFGAVGVSASASHSHQHNSGHGLATHSVIRGKEETVQASPQSRTTKSYSIKKGIGAAEETAQVSKPIDVLVLYTQRVEDHEGGPEQVQATIENEMAKTNQVLKNSGLSHRRMRLAAAEKVDYVQRHHLGRDLLNLRYTSARNSVDVLGRDFSALDEVFPLIEQHQADMVVLFVRDGLGVCGQAGAYSGSHDYWVQKDCENSGNYNLCVYNARRRVWAEKRFSVTAIKCAVRGYIFVHELGHNLALAHDRGDEPSHNYDNEYYIERGYFPWYKAYAFGYQNVDFSEICQVTVMSAGNACIKAGIYGQLRVPYFSNPDLFFPPPPDNYDLSSFKRDTPMGVPGDQYTTALDGPVKCFQNY